MASNAEKADSADPTAECKDAELEDLLDSALEDFDRQPTSADSKVKDKVAEGQAPSTAAEADNLEDIWSEDAMKEAMMQFEKTVKTLCNSYGGDSAEGELMAEQLSEDFCKMAKETMSTVLEGSKDKMDLDETIKETLKNLADNSRDLQEGAGNPEDLMNMFRNGLDLGQEDGEVPSDISSYCCKIVQMLLSKETLYQPFKELCEKYPEWLEENKSKLSEEQLTKYSSQLEVMKKVCAEFENMSEDDSEDVKSKKFSTVLKLMQEMQDYGYPPEELIGSSTMNISNEMISGLLPGGMGAPPGDCSIM